MKATEVFCALAAACAAFAQPVPRPAPRPSTPAGELAKAADEFRTVTRNLGLRPDSPATVRTTNISGPRWHGRLFHNIRNNSFDAVPHEVTQRGGQRGLLRRNQFGFNASGPLPFKVLSQPTFLTVTFEGMREKAGRADLRTIPTALERTGDWSRVVDQAGRPLPIFDPASTAPNPAFDAARPVTASNLQFNRAPFPGNIIPRQQLDPRAQQLLRHYPAPNADAGPFDRNNFFAFNPEVNSANGVILRADQPLTNRHRLGFHLNYSNGQDGVAAIFNTPANPSSVSRDRRNRAGTLEHVFTVSPRTLNTATISASSDQYLNRPELDESGKPFGSYRFQPYLSMGRSYPNARNIRNVFAATNSLGTRRGRHHYRVIGQLIREQINTLYPQYPEGRFQFSANLTSLPGIVNTGHAFASFLLGGPEYAERSIAISPSYFRRSRYYFGLRDQIELRSGLTVSLALNIEGGTPRVERYNRQSTISLSAVNPVNGLPGAMTIAAHDGNGRAFQPTVWKPEPSASLAWNLLGDTKSVLRAGYSRSYSPLPMYFSQWGTQAFNGNPTWYSQNPQLEPAIWLNRGFPPLQRPFPDLRPESANETTADLAEPRGLQPTYQSASLSLERELPGAMLLTIGCGHQTGRNLFLSNSGSNPNHIPPSALVHRDRLNSESFKRTLRPFPHFQRFDVYSSWPEGRYQRDAAQLRLEKRTSNGLSLAAYYEFSKQMDNYSGPSGVQDFSNRQNEWSLTSSNAPHRVSLTYLYELPFGGNRALWNYQDWRRHLVDGWSVSGATSVASGEPVALRPQFNNTGGIIDALNVNPVPGADPHVANPGPNRWFNPAAFVQPPDFTLGAASRTHPSLRMPGDQNHDLSLNKRIGLSAERSIEFTAVGLNFLNLANWTDPDTTIGTLNAPNVNAGRIIGSRGGRVIQLGLRFSF